MRVVQCLEGAVALDLSDVISIDDAGVMALRDLSRRGVRLIGASPYLVLLLGEHGPGEGPAKPRRRG